MFVFSTSLYDASILEREISWKCSINLYIEHAMKGFPFFSYQTIKNVHQLSGGGSWMGMQYYSWLFIYTWTLVLTLYGNNKNLNREPIIHLSQLYVLLVSNNMWRCKSIRYVNLTDTLFAMLLVFFSRDFSQYLFHVGSITQKVCT